MTELRIATRTSPLALWQAEAVARQLQLHHPRLKVALVQMKTRGDEWLNTPLSKVGGKGLFVKELEAGLLAGRADIAVHSMKDVPVSFPEGLELGAVMAREDPRDAFVSNHYQSLDDLPAGAIVGTSSLRRQAQIQTQYPELKIDWLRGNINTRLSKLDAGGFDAIILASAGLIRLGLSARIQTPLAPEECLPAIGQGVLGIEVCRDAAAIRQLLEPLNDAETRILITAERALNKALNGGCQVPVAGYAILRDGQIYLRGLVAEPDGSRIIRAEIYGSTDAAEDLGVALAADLIAQGAHDILARIL